MAKTYFSIGHSVRLEAFRTFLLYYSNCESAIVLRVGELILTKYQDK